MTGARTRAVSGLWTKPKRHTGNRLPAAAVGAGAFFVYLTTLSPTVASNDAGRFQIAAPVLGTGHPTGYPTFILLGKLFTYLPLGDVAYRVNLMAAVFGAVAAALLFLVSREVGSDLLPAAGAAFILAFASTFWSQATVAEVYTMHAAFLLGISYLLLRWRGTGRGGYVLLAALLYGISLGNNAGMVLLVPAYLVLLLAGRYGRLSRRVISGSAGLFFLGLSVYAYVPIRGFAGAWHNYGDAVNSWADAWVLVSGARFQGLMSLSPIQLFGGSTKFFQFLFGQAPQPLGFLLGSLLLLGGARGAWALLRRDGVVGSAFVAGLGFTLVYALGYRIDDIAVYYIPVYTFLAVFVAVGVSRSAGYRGRMLLAAVPLLVAVLTLFANYGEQDRSGYYAERERSEAVLEQLPEDAVLYGKVQIIPVTYLQEVEGQRADVTLRWLDGGTQEDHMSSDVESGRPVYVISDPRYNEEYLESTESYARREQEGALIRLRPR
ncbi:MAG: DUF2723 domain-containing protein [Rubrobacteraceae bacterium]